MSNKSGLEMNKKLLKLQAKYKERREELKKKIIDQSIDIDERFQYMLDLNALPRRSSPVRLVRRCTITGKSGVFRITNLCSAQMRQKITQGLLPGFFKASW